ncbi:hypothetical protein MNEG_1184 [Monoraphidium neglectum]|uniref:Uncharacterized protein n=1 Tax=Monoraphidium neglectum TaxID=145388 RepID=A0A0D2LK70_9CHLO|nr:hypothetical protein MNEG_1184 [Monoraphidium neglectum]KIZ06774.1 hypothetical protein MNEG_1184 [Monoraphidium neglectum]|eukprot:XP_013905793.1 hypothetical protein MNEG_1184 [Monoraphidium neglectum]
MAPGQSDSFLVTASSAPAAPSDGSSNLDRPRDLAGSYEDASAAAVLTVRTFEGDLCHAAVVMCLGHRGGGGGPSADLGVCGADLFAQRIAGGHNLLSAAVAPIAEV